MVLSNSSPDFAMVLKGYFSQIFSLQLLPDHFQRIFFLSLGFLLLAAYDKTDNVFLNSLVDSYEIVFLHQPVDS